MWAAALALCVLGAATQSAEPGPGPGQAPPGALSARGRAAGRDKRSSLSDQWINILSEYARDAAAGSGRDGAGGVKPLRPFTVDLPVGGGSGRRAATLPLLVLPLPVALPAGGRAECDARRADSEEYDDDDYEDDKPSRRRPADRGRAPSGSRRDQPRRRPEDKSRYQPDDIKSRYQPDDSEPRRWPYDSEPRRRPYDNESRRRLNDGEPRHRPDEAEQARRPTPPRARPPVPDAPAVTEVPIPVTSQQLVEQFRAQMPVAPHLPPALFPLGEHHDRGVDVDLRFGAGGGAAQGRGDAGGRSAGGVEGASNPRAYLPPPAPPAPFAPRSEDPAAPPRPRFARSLMMRAELSVPHADYTEPYTAWWDSASGAARVDFHEAGTSTYRMALSDGRMQRIEVRTDRTGEREVVRCGVARAAAPAPADRAPPALPDLDLFSFVEYTTEGGSRAERWQRVVRGGPGELGAARGEALLYTHDLLLARAQPAGDAMPLRYTVTVDSSVLGARCDSYEHRYVEARAQDHDPALFALDVERRCETREQLDEAEPEHMARLEPLREFTLPRRDPRHDIGLQRFVNEFERSYVDDTEEAVRKNLFVQHTRFVSSCNRQSASFEVEVNFLGDRLDVELDVLLGVRFDAEADDAESFPYSGSRLRQFKRKLPREFDWRPRGAVSEVYYQGSCSSCWAFAVTGSVEGALFVRTRRLVPLSVQCLVDCAHSHGAHGCSGTWPSHAYDYVQDRGQPARDEYPAYQEKVLPCQDRRVPPVTHISGHVNVPPNDTEALKVAIRRQAPSVVVIDARPKSFMFYKKGVLRDERCLKGPKQKLNHAVLAVGWGEQRGEAHFILKNTYSAKWGDGGYIRLHAPSNTCGVLTLPSYARLQRADIDRLPGGGGGGAGGAADDDDDYGGGQIDSRAAADGSAEDDYGDRDL